VKNSTVQRSPVDKLITQLDKALRASAGSVGKTNRGSPAETIQADSLSDNERRESARLMRVNHCGEVCAQALYQGQALTAKSNQVSRSMQQAAEEETDHLAWCETRLKELDASVSYLNPFWYVSSFAMGAVAGLLGDKINLGFVAATEDQVCRHLEDHLQKLPGKDEKSRAILAQMKSDEARHMHTAQAAGAAQFPLPARSFMTMISKLMTRSTYWV